MKYDLAIFDCDGVFVDSEPISNRILADLLTSLGMPMTIEESMRQFMGKSRATNVAAMERALGRTLPADFFPEYERRAYAAFENELERVPGIVEALDAVAIPTCVASSGERAKMRLTLRQAGLIDRFAGCIFSATEVKRGKPFPDVFCSRPSGWAYRQRGAQLSRIPFPACRPALPRG